jgi:hypothetical protein
VTTTNLPPARAAELRKALRANAGQFIARYYRHEVLRARAVKGVQRDAVDEFQRTIVAPTLRAVAGSLSTFDQRGPAIAIDRYPELRALQAEVVGIVNRGAESVRRLTDNRLDTLTRQEVEWGRDTAVRTLKVELPTIGETNVLREARERPFLGQRFDGWFRDMLTQPAAANAMQWIQTGISRGLSTDAIVAGLRGTSERGYTDGWLTGSGRDLTTLVRTAATHYAATANSETFKAMGFDRYRWLDTLDVRTCVTCAALAKRSMDEGGFILGEGPMPPTASHPRCRCGVLPWLGEPEGTRASTDGPVPADLTLPKWLEGRSIAEQDELLGRTRAVAWRAGKLEFDDMIGRDMQLLSIAELRRLDRLPED